VRPVSDRFLKVVRSSHQKVVRATVVAPWQVGVTPTGTQIAVISGDVQADITADITSTLDLTASFPWPLTSSALGNPYGSEIFIERGIQYGDGGTEWVGLGYFRINNIQQDVAPNGTLVITGEDRMANIRDGRPLNPIQFGAGATVSSVINFIVNDVMPGVPVVYDWPATDTLAVAQILTDNRLTFLQTLVKSYGKIMYFDYAGRLQVKTPPNVSGLPVEIINSGANGVLCNLKRNLSRDGVYNAVQASGQAASELPPVLGVAYDSNPASPTYFFGPFGKVVEYFSSTFLQTVAQCNSAAITELAKVTGLPYVVSLGRVPNPALEVSDVIQVSYAARAPAEIHIADKITYPLDTGTQMIIQTRKQTVT
jgi:hypothetical protein